MSKSRGEVSHWPLHVFLVLFTILSSYPILWVFTIAFSGKQNLAIADVPPNPTTWDRVRAIIPWPDAISMSNFVSVMKDQPFGRWKREVARRLPFAYVAYAGLA